LLYIESEMVVVMFPRIAAMKVESSWGHGRQGVVRCVARLTRALTSPEEERLRDLVPLEEIHGDRVVWFCRPEEVEALQEKVGLALDLATRRASHRKRSGLRLSRNRGPSFAR
jgi:hypothetical protein